MSVLNARMKAVAAELFHEQIAIITVSQSWEINSGMRLTDVSPI